MKNNVQTTATIVNESRQFLEVAKVRTYDEIPLADAWKTLPNNTMLRLPLNSAKMNIFKFRFFNTELQEVGKSKKEVRNYDYFYRTVVGTEEDQCLYLRPLNSFGREMEKLLICNSAASKQLVRIRGDSLSLKIGEYKIMWFPSNELLNYSWQAIDPPEKWMFTGIQYGSISLIPGKVTIWNEKEIVNRVIEIKQSYPWWIKKGSRRR